MPTRTRNRTAAEDWGVGHLPPAQALAECRYMREEIAAHGGAEALPFTPAELERLDALIADLEEAEDRD